MRAVYGIFLFLLIASCFPAYALDLEKLNSQAASMTAQLNGNCSATLIHSKRDEKSGDVLTVFLTAKHCVEDSRDTLQYLDMPVYQEGRVVKRDRYTAKVKGRSWKYDLALIELLDKQTWFEKTATISRSLDVPNLGSEVVVLGYPLGLQLTVTAGLFGSLESIDFPKPNTEFYRATPDIVGGNSGGGMFIANKEGDYELIGVSAAAHQIYSHISLYVPTYAIHEYLKVALPAAVGE